MLSFSNKSQDVVLANVYFQTKSKFLLVKRQQLTKTLKPIKQALLFLGGALKPCFHF